MTNAPQVRIFEQPATHQVSSSKDYKPNLSIHGVHSLGKRRTFPVVEVSYEDELRVRNIARASLHLR